MEGEGMELWPGYLTSIRQHENGILMCADVTYKVMRQQTLLDILKECYQNSSANYKVRILITTISLI